MISRRLFLLNAATCLPSLTLAQAFSNGASSIKAQDLPVRLDLSRLMTPVKKQGDRDTCAYFSTVAILESLLKQRLGRQVVLSEEFLIHNAERKHKRVESETTSIMDTLNAAKVAGCVTEGKWPYRPDLFGKGQVCEQKAAAHLNLTDCFVGEDPPAALYKDAAKLRLTRASQYHRIGGAIDYGKSYAAAPQYVNLLMTTMASSKQALLAIITLPNSNEGWRGDGEVTVPSSMLQMNEREIKMEKSHIVVFTGFDRMLKMFYFKNSWGTDWGDKGYGRINFDVLTTPFFRDAFFFKGGFISVPQQL